MRKYKVKGILKCTSKNVIYLISCKCCGKQYIGSAISFKERFRIHKSDINTGKVRCGVAFVLGIHIMLKQAYLFLYAHCVVGSFMILIPVAEILNMHTIITSLFDLYTELIT